MGGRKTKSDEVGFWGEWWQFFPPEKLFEKYDRKWISGVADLVFLTSHLLIISSVKA